jgi:cobalt/nickel transport system ATP-binding protein
VTALSIRDLRFSYPEKPSVLSKVNLDVAPGEKTGIIGPNGSGKTTLFLLIAGILKPDSGSIALNGEPVKPGRFNPHFGMVFQNPDDQLFSVSVGDDIAFGLRNMGFGQEEIELRVGEMLESLEMSDLAERPPHHLSGGEKRMISLAGVRVMNPDIIALDEPDASLDSRSRRRLIGYVQSSDETMLIASHDLEFILETCSRIAVLDEGRICAYGDPTAVMNDFGLMEAHGLEKPHSLVPHSEPHHGRNF